MQIGNYVSRQTHDVLKCDLGMPHWKMTCHLKHIEHQHIDINILNIRYTNP